RQPLESRSRLRTAGSAQGAARSVARSHRAGKKNLKTRRGTDARALWLDGPGASGSHEIRQAHVPFALQRIALLRVDFFDSFDVKTYSRSPFTLLASAEGARPSRGLCF